MKTSKLLVVVIVLQSLMLLGQWVGPSYVASAQAQSNNDPARDRLQTLDELRSINAKLDKLADILGSGDLQVRVANPDDIKGKSGGR